MARCLPLMGLSQYVLVWLVSCAGTFAVAQEDSAARWAANARELNWQRQWAVEATASSSYSETGGWSVSQVLGYPDTTGYGDIGTAWAPAGVLNAQVGTDVHADWFRIHVDTSVPGRNETDAVEIVGNPIP